MITAHILGLPAEELLLPIASGGGTLLLVLRTWAGSALRRLRRARG